MRERKLEFTFNLEIKVNGKETKEVKANGSLTATDLKGMMITAIKELGEELDKNNEKEVKQPLRNKSGKRINRCKKCSDGFDPVK